MFSKVSIHDLFECSTASFAATYGLRDTKVTAEEEYKLKSTLNEALETKLKEKANHVLKYIIRHKVSL